MSFFGKLIKCHQRATTHTENFVYTRLLRYEYLKKKKSGGRFTFSPPPKMWPSVVLFVVRATPGSLTRDGSLIIWF